MGARDGRDEVEEARGEEPNPDPRHAPGGGRSRSVLMGGLILAVLAILLARSAWGRATPASLEGTWVSSETLQGLEARRAVEVGCYLVASAEPLSLEERCGERRTQWGWLEIDERKGSVEVKDGLRRLVNRAGTPNELELTSGGELRRLYRISPEQEETVAEWAMLPPAPAPAEEGAAAPEAAAIEPLPVEVKSEPIVPRSRFGCAAAQGSTASALGLVIAGALWSHPRRKSVSLEAREFVKKITNTREARG